MLIQLKRIAYLEETILGVLLLNGMPKYTTLERSWKNNKTGESCIKTGEYTCSKYQSRRFGSTYIVETVENRSGILFHQGNTYRDTEGCILVGKTFGLIGELPAILSSQVAFSSLLSDLKGVESFKLKIEAC